MNPSDPPPPQAAHHHPPPQPPSATPTINTKSRKSNRRNSTSVTAATTINSTTVPAGAALRKSQPATAMTTSGGEKVYDFTAGDFMAMTAAMTRPVKALPRSKRRRGAEGGEPEESTTNGPFHAFAAPLDTTAGNGALGSFPMPPYLYYPPNGFPFAGDNTTTTPMGDMNMTMMMTMDPATNTNNLPATATNNNGIFDYNLTTITPTITVIPAVLDDMTDGHDMHDHDRERDQQGNTKKRKVPAAAHHHFRSGSGGGLGDDGGVGSVPGGVGGGLDERYGRDDFDSEPRSLDATTAVPGTASSINGGGATKRRLPFATDVNMRTKELVRKRRRLVSSLVTPAAGNPYSDTTLAALDYVLADPTLNWQLRALATLRESLSSPQRPLRARDRRRRKPPPTGEDGRCAIPARATFSFVSPSPAGERFRTLSDAMFIWKAKFQLELARLATAKKIAERAAESKRPGARKKMAPSTGGNGNGSHKSTPTSATGGLSTNDANGNGAKTNGSTKKNKKRGGGNNNSNSNAKTSDPHRPGNYIPSRLPAAAGLPTLTPAQAAASVANLVSPLPVRFLSADVKPRRNGGLGVTSSLPPVQPEVEWICAFCEYDLFFGFGGEEVGWRRAVRARKKLLRRRRRARERAAAAASGQSVKSIGRRRDEGDDDDYLNQEAKFEDPKAVEERINAVARSVLRERDKLMEGVGVGADGA